MYVQTIFNLILLIWGILFAIFLICSKKYGTARKKAFAMMKKTKIIVYCIPLLFCLIIMVSFYNELADPYNTGVVWGWVLTIGVLIGIIMFDVFETIPESRTEKKLHRIGE